MPALLIKDLPDELHRKLKESATRHRRCMTKEALALLEGALESGPAAKELPPPFRGRTPLTQAFLDRVKDEGRS